MPTKLVPADECVSSSVQALEQSRIYRDYQRAFTKGLQLPLDLHEPQMSEVICFPKDQENPFCALMAKASPACAACYEMQQKLEQAAKLKPATLKCFAGLCESAVPVRIGEKLIAFLHTGQVLLRDPTEREFNRIASTLLKWGANVDLKQLEEAYFHTRVLSPEQYEAFIRLLAIFAEHLAACSAQWLLEPQEKEPPAVVEARSFIASHSEEALTLRHVAQTVNLSATYFSELFRKTTGMNFVDYVARTRVEKAKNLLQNPNLRITAIAFEVGFQSLSQFNRVFKKTTGHTPREYRCNLMAAKAGETV